MMVHRFFGTIPYMQGRSQKFIKRENFQIFGWKNRGKIKEKYIKLGKFYFSPNPLV